MLHRPAPQIISRPATSVTAVGLPSDCTSKFTNLIPTSSFTNRTFRVCISGCDVCTWQFSGFGFQEISVSITVVYFTDRAKCKTVLLFTHPQTLDGDFCCHTSVAVWYSVTALRAAVFKCPSSKLTGLNFPYSCDVVMWLCGRGVR